MGRGGQARPRALRDGRRDAAGRQGGDEARRGQAAYEDAFRQRGRHGRPEMKVDELRVLEADELGMRLRTARRELYELRFKHAVGQLENSSQISKVRHDIARIMTVLRERDFGFGPTTPEEMSSPQSGEVVAVATGGAAHPDADSEDEAVVEEAPKPKRA